MTLHYYDSFNGMHTAIIDNKEIYEEYKSYLTALESFETTEQPEMNFDNAEKITTSDTELCFPAADHFLIAETDSSCLLIRLEQSDQKTGYYAVKTESSEGHLFEKLIITLDTALSGQFENLCEALLNSDQDPDVNELAYGYESICDGNISTYRKALGYMLETDRNLYYIKLISRDTDEEKYYEIDAESSNAAELEELTEGIQKAEIKN